MRRAGKTDREGHAGHRKGERASPDSIKIFNHAKERGGGALGERFKDAPRGRASREHALILGEAAETVHPVPFVDRVERIKELLERHKAGIEPRRLAPVFKLVEGADTERVQHPRRKIEREPRRARGPREASRELFRFGKTPTIEHASAKRIPF